MLNSTRSRSKHPGAMIEALERRVLLTSVVVNATLDDNPAGLVTLRDAISIADSSTTPTTITFDPTVFATAQTILLNGLRLTLNNTKEATTIIGPAAGLTISGVDYTRIFFININTTVSMSGLTIVDGYANDHFGRGGAILVGNHSIFTLTNSTLTDNTGATGGDGGGLANLGGITTLTNVTISNNTISGMGGGIYNTGTLTIIDSTISGNSAGGNGGGIESSSTSSVPPILTLKNVTIEGNSAGGPDGNGGGLDAGGGSTADGTASLYDVTISDNTAINNGGGVSIDRSVLSIFNTIIAGNTTHTGIDPDVVGAFASNGHNLVGDKEGSSGWISSDLTGTTTSPLNAKLGPLANNGGLTQTMALLSGSPAIDAGSNALIPTGITTDQRGAGFPRIFNGTVDIGAYEAQSHLVFHVEPGNVIAGNKIAPSVVVYIENGKDQIITTDHSSVTLSKDTGLGTLGGTVTVAAVDGIATFSNLIITIAGAGYTLQAKDGNDIAAVSTAFTVSHAAIAHLAFVQNPTNAIAGTNDIPAITVKATDVYGNAISGASIKLAIGSGPTGGALFGTITATTAATGIATFSTVSLHIAGSYTLTASDGAIISPKSMAFTVSAAKAGKLVFTTLPADAKHSVAFTVKVSVEDVYGNVLIGQSTGTITLALATHPTGSTLGGTLTANVVKGVATFGNLTVSLAGSYSFKETDSFAVAAATSASIVVS